FNKVIFHPLLAPIKENFAFVSIELARNVDRAAQVVPELVVVNGCGESGCRVRVARPGIRIQGSVAEVFVGSAVKLAGTGLGRDANLSTGRTSVFGCVI